MKKLTLCVAAALTAAASTASAQEAPPYENWVGLFGQYYSADRMKNQPAGGLTDGKGFGGEVGFRFDPTWAIRFELGRLVLGSESNNPFASDDDGLQLGADIMYFVEGDGAYFFGGLREQSLNAESYRMAAAGVGKHWELNENLRLITEVAAYHDFGQQYHEYSAKVGLAYIFGVNTVASNPDSDNDGVYDAVDRCPSTPAGMQVDATGCNIDMDGDGVLNAQDQCPMTAKGAEVDAKGCDVVVNLDTDNDGVLDSRDECLGTPKGNKVDTDGCSIVIRKEVSVKLEMFFENNSSAITNPDSAQIEEFAAFMAKYPTTEAVIEGHTSVAGTDEYNLMLSTKRAQAVRALLINDYSVDANRLEAIGYGETRLRDTANTRAANKVNRRIEVKVSIEVAEKVKP